MLHHVRLVEWPRSAAQLALCRPLVMGDAMLPWRMTALVTRRALRRTATIKGVCSDLFAQLVVEKRRQPEWRRTLAFCSFGAVYLGAYAHYKYTFLYSFLFGSAKTVPIITTKILADLLISAPLIYYPIYYGFKGALFGSARSELRKYFSAHGIAMVLRYWAVWCAKAGGGLSSCAEGGGGSIMWHQHGARPPSWSAIARPSLTPLIVCNPAPRRTPTFVVMWTLIPVHMRIPFVCVVSLVWQVALSTLSCAAAHPELCAPCAPIPSTRAARVLLSKPPRELTSRRVLFSRVRDLWADVSSPDGRTDGRDSPAAPARPEDRFVDVIMREGGDDIASIRRCPRRRGVLRLRGSWLGMSRP